GILWALFVMVLMRWLRRALHEEVMERVRAMAENRNPAPLQHRAMAELREVSRVISTAHEQVRVTTVERNARIESLELELNQDPVTGLANRKYFINELRRVLEQPAQGEPADDAAVGGHVMLFRQRDLQSINQSMSRPIADQWLANVGAMITTVLKSQVGEDAWLARLNGSDFAFMLPLMPGPEAGRIVQAVRQILQAQRLALPDNHFCRWSMALTDFEGSEDLGTILARLDAALMRAESSGQDDVEYLPIGNRAGTQTGEQAWRVMLQKAFDDGWLELAVSRTQAPGSTERSEGLLVLREPGTPEPLSGYLFMPPATRLGLSDECDLRAINLGLRWLHKYPGELVVRLSHASILKDNFTERVGAALDADPVNAPRLLLELDAFGLVSDHEAMAALAACATKSGARIGLRRFAEQPEVVMRLQGLPIDYIKISGGRLVTDTDNPGARNLLKAIYETATELGVNIIVETGPKPR
ncbi:MAG: EAL domain-containing protein, partial [Sinobacteraceae bacterium]|nr:EAL domain-containing protein [Nevskiaceae bacterium]